MNINTANSRCATHAFSRKTGIQIYNYGSGKDNPLTWKEFFHWSEKFAETFAILYIYVGLYFVMLLTNPHLFKFCQFIFHILPAYCIDAYSKLMGKEPRYDVLQAWLYD